MRCILNILRCKTQEFLIHEQSCHRVIACQSLNCIGSILISLHLKQVAGYDIGYGSDYRKLFIAPLSDLIVIYKAYISGEITLIIEGTADI